MKYGYFLCMHSLIFFLIFFLNEKALNLDINKEENPTIRIWTFSSIHDLPKPKNN